MVFVGRPGTAVTVAKSYVAYRLLRRGLHRLPHDPHHGRQRRWGGADPGRPGPPRPHPGLASPPASWPSSLLAGWPPGPWRGCWSRWWACQPPPCWPPRWRWRRWRWRWAGATGCRWIASRWPGWGGGGSPAGWWSPPTASPQRRPGQVRQARRWRRSRGPVRGLDPAGVVDLGGQGWALVCVATPVNLSLRTPPEQQALLASFARLLHALTGPMQVLVRSDRADLTPLVHRPAGAGRGPAASWVGAGGAGPRPLAGGPDRRPAGPPPPAAGRLPPARQHHHAPPRRCIARPSRPPGCWPSPG